MRFELFIARRYLRAKRRKAFIGIITAGQANQTARTISYRRGEKIKKRPLIAMLRQIVANNRAGGWRKLKRS